MLHEAFVVQQVTDFEGYYKILNNTICEDHECDGADQKARILDGELQKKVPEYGHFIQKFEDRFGIGTEVVPEEDFTPWFRAYSAVNTKP